MDSTASVVQDVVVVDLLAERYRAAFAKTKEGRAQWVEGTLELVVVVQDARRNYPDHHDYHRWLARNSLREISKSDLSALNQFALDLTVARQLLEQAKTWSWQQVWRTRPDKPAKCALPESRKGTLSHRSGSTLRKRRSVVPTVMREDYVPGSVPRSANPSRRRRRGSGSGELPKERPLPILKGLTREQVDPDFDGTPQEFVAKYGLVNLHTKEEIEYHKRQEELAAWLARVTDHAQSAHALLAVTVDPVALREWMTKPLKAAKLQGWRNAITAAHEMLLDLQEKEANSEVQTLPVR